MDSIESTLPGGVETADAVAPIRAGTKIGRYVVLDRLGAGGMGVVYTAFDPELDRRIALKLLLPHVRDREQGRRRLLREAQALARLRHPNVVGVHDVGVHGEAIFVAMELLPGRTLRAWLAEAGGRRPWRQVAAAFAQVARGLAAAHDVGLVHRDFKPDNAMIADDPRRTGAPGKVCVLDFGLARALAAGDGAASTEHTRGSAPLAGVDVPAQAMARVRERLQKIGRIAVAGDPPPVVPSATPTDALLGERLTRQGALLGTPSYMAPEQLAGAEVDGRCDQYALCVAIFEALHGHRPFAGDTPAALLVAITRAEPTPSSGVSVPAWLHRLVMRGLAMDPGARHPSMAVLAETLAQAPRRRRRAVVAIAAAGVGLVGIASFAAREDPCARGASALQDAWTAEARTDTIAALSGLALPYAAATADRVASQLDSYANDWVAMYEDACRATHDRRAQSTELLDRRVACLDTRRRALGAFAGLLRIADAALLEQAVEGAEHLPAVRDCGDLERLLAVDAAPTTGPAREAFDLARDRLAQATAAELAGRYADGLVDAEAAVDGARALGLDALVADAELVRGRLLEGAGRRHDADAALRAAVFHAQLADHDRVQAEATIELVYVTGYRESRFDEGKWWATIARGLVERQAEPTLRARLDNHTGVLLHAAGELDAAVGHLEQALAARIAALGPDHLDVAESHYNLAGALRRAGRTAEARDHHGRSLAIRAAALGPDHPRVAESHAQLGMDAAALGEFEAATIELQRAAEIQRDTLGPAHPRRADTLTALGNARARSGDLERAEADQREALAILEVSVGVDDAQVDRARHNLALTLAERGRHADARDLLASVAAARERRLGPNHPDLARTLTQLGRARLTVGEHAAAVIDLGRALAILEPGSDALATARARLGLAMALAATRGERARIQDLAVAARDAFAAAGPAGAEGLREAEQVLATLAVPPG